MGFTDYDLSRDLLNLVCTVAEKLGQTNAQFQDLPDFQTRRAYRVDTIYATMNMNSAGPSRERIAAILESRWVKEPEESLLETYNTIRLYHEMHSLDPWTEGSLRSAHRMLRRGLGGRPGRYRKGLTFADYRVFFIEPAPPPDEITNLMSDLFKFLNRPGEHLLIKAIIAQFLIDFYQPFEFGNGILSRFWQSLILIQGYRVMEFIPYETLLLKTRRKFELVFRESIQKRNPTPFITYMLQQFDQAISDYLDHCRYSRGPDQRLTYFLNLNPETFTRKDYLRVFKYISPSTASNDLAMGVQSGLFTKKGKKNKTVYSCLLPFE